MKIERFKIFIENRIYEESKKKHVKMAKKSEIYNSTY